MSYVHQGGGLEGKRAGAGVELWTTAGTSEMYLGLWGAGL